MSIRLSVSNYLTQQIHVGRGAVAPLPFLSDLTMFKRFLVVVIGMLTVSFSVDAQKKTSVSFDAGVFDMGAYPSDCCVLSKTFSFTNTGSEKLYFLDAKTDCSCVKVTIPKKPVAPGKRGAIRVDFDGNTKPLGCFSGWIYFASNTDPERFRVRIFASKYKAQAK